MTVSPASLPIAFRVPAFTGNLWRPSPRAMNALSNGSSSTVPRTFTVNSLSGVITENDDFCGRAESTQT